MITPTLETFDNPYPDRDYLVRIEAPEFTCLCPKTGQPDFATLRIEYIPDRLCVELKALKLYLFSFRDVGAFHEQVANDIATYFEHMVQPRSLTLTMAFWTRGGIDTTIVVEGGLHGGQKDPGTSQSAA